MLDMFRQNLAQCVLALSLAGIRSEDLAQHGNLSQPGLESGPFPCRLRRQYVFRTSAGDVVSGFGPGRKSVLGHPGVMQN